MDKHLDINDFSQYPLYKGLIELNKRMEESNLPHISLNVVGGFAMMIHDIREKESVTDIDYVGKPLPYAIKDIAEEIKDELNLPKDWINNDLMLMGSSLEDLEYSTGKLNFTEAFELSKITINVIEPRDLTRMKVIALDTALTAIEMGGDFTRMKDFRDVLAIKKAYNLTYNDIYKDSRDYLINPSTIKFIKYYEREGPEKTLNMIKVRQAKIMNMYYGDNPRENNVFKEQKTKSDREDR